MVEFFSAAIPLRVWRYLKDNEGYNLMKMQFLHACTKSLYIVNVNLLLFYFIVSFWHSVWPNRSIDCNIRRIISNSASIHKFSLC